MRVPTIPRQCVLRQNFDLLIGLWLDEGENVTADDKFESDYMADIKREFQRVNSIK